MSMARANVEMAKSSHANRNKVVAKASEVVGPLLAPSRHVVDLLSGLGALYPPCKQVSNSLAVSVPCYLSDPHWSHTLSSCVQVLIKHEVNRHEKDVRVAIVHFDLVCYSSVWRNCRLILIACKAIALVHIGSLNHKSRPAKSVGDPLSKLLKNLRGVIQEFKQFCECV